ncbi:MAG: hypothetical protein EXS05_14955 [Planctomycetaceae bacterium]|nr:hypothetical protein [Planctomycetaceae bacterium]
MNCFDFERELQDRLDRGFVGESESLRSHRQSCPNCQGAWHETRLLAEAIVAWREQLPEVDLVDSIVAAEIDTAPRSTVISPTMHAQLSQSVAHTTRAAGAGRRRLQAAGFLAASVASVLMAWALWPDRKPDRDARDGQPVATGEAPTGDRAGRLAVAVSDPAPLQAVASNAADEPYGTLARSAIGAWEDFAWSIVPGAPQPAVSEGASTDSERWADSERWIDGLEHQLRPIGRGVGDAFDFLWQAGQAPDNSRT